MVLHACCEKAKKDLLRKHAAYVARAAFWKRPNRMWERQMTFAKNISLMKEQLKVASDLECVQHQDHRDRRWDV
jgi:hypothetical protein